jgi:acetylornithine aminotransferase/acetylornithine/N-succinyldiaminopimelate aminotransferase
VSPSEADDRAALERAIGPLPGTTAEAMAAEAAGQVPTYSKWPIALVSGSGCHVTDAEGKRYLDLYGGHAVALPGHCHPRVVAAIRAQAGRLLFYSQVVHVDVRAAALSALLALAPRGLRRVFLCNSGTEANETALKLARKHTGRMRVVSLSDGFHGRTLGSLGATGLPTYRDPAYPIPTEHDYVPYGDLAAMGTAVGPQTAAVIVEPIPSMGGIRVASAEWFRGLRALCTERGALLIFDEVQTGWGRTGKTWTGEHFGVTPDLVTTAKGAAGGFPAGVVFVREDLAAKVRLGEQGTTFGGGPLACAAIAANCRVIREENLAENAARVGGAWKAALARVPGVLEVTGLGLMLGVNLDRPAKPVIQALVSAGFLTGSCEANPNQVRLLPPLVLTEAEAATFTRALESALAHPAPAAAPAARGA